MMVIFPCLLYYLWTCLTLYEGKFQYPSSPAQTIPWLRDFSSVVWQHAAPTWHATKLYFGFMAFQLGLALVMPGYKQEGLPIASLKGKKLIYNCNGLGTWYTTLVTVAFLQYSGLFDISVLIDEFGPIMTVAMISSYVLAAVCYFGTVFFGRPLRMSGNFIYDYFSSFCQRVIYA
jgi:delta24(24(1))-sterol reductase